MIAPLDARVQQATNIIKESAQALGETQFSAALSYLGFQQFLQYNDFGALGLHEMIDAEKVMLAAGLAYMRSHPELL